MNRLIATALIIAIPIISKAEVQAIVDTGFILENKIQVSTDPTTTWQAFIEEVDNWWPKDHSWWLEEGTFSIEPYAGGCFCERASDGRSAEHMHIAFVDPGKALRMTGGLGPLQGMGMFGALTFTFTETDTGTDVTMVYQVNGFNSDGFQQLAPIVDTVQGMQLGGLKTYLDSN
jgi:uncharacterized protein YndB with AHSA1/START domain